MARSAAENNDNRFRPESVGAPRNSTGVSTEKLSASEGTDLLPKALRVLKLLLPYGRRHSRLFVRGSAAAIAVVAARLALPWPLREVADLWVAGGAPANLIGSTLVVDPVLSMGLVFLILVLLLGLADFLERLYFARFAIAAVRDLRADALAAAVRGKRRGTEARIGDLVARLVGDTARLKTGLRGFFVHVATNGILLLGVTAVLFFIDSRLGSIFAAATLATALVTAWSGARIFRASLKQRNKEGRLAEEIQQVVAQRRTGKAFKRINKSSGHHEARQTRLQGIATWATHGIFGVAVLLVLTIGAKAVDAGEVAAGDLVVFMMYALTIRGPIVRLARQGARCGRILGAAHRVVILLGRGESTRRRDPVEPLWPLGKTLGLHRVHLPARHEEGTAPLHSIDLELRLGERIAIVGDPESGAGPLVEILAGLRVPAGGAISWDDVELAPSACSRLTTEVAFAPKIPEQRTQRKTLETRLLTFLALVDRDASIWIFDEPLSGLKERTEKKLLKSVLGAEKMSTVIFRLDRPRPRALKRFDRVIALDGGRIVFDGLPTDWLEDR